MKGVPLNENLYQYIIDTFAAEDNLLRSLIKETEKQGLPLIQVSPENGKFLQLLIRMINAKNVLEIGTLTGYSAIWIARALPEDGKLITLELEPKHAELAKKYIVKAGLHKKIEIRVGAASVSLKNLSEERFDLVFIDADKENYVNYLHKVIPLMNKGGVIAADNTLRKGEVINLKTKDEGTIEVRNFNKLIAKDKRFESILVPISDGLTIAFYKG